MMKKTFKTILILVAALSLTFASSLAGTACGDFPVQLGYPGGNAGLANHVTPNLGCEVGDPLENDTDPLAWENIGFGLEIDWTRMGKIEDLGGEQTDGQLTVDGDGMSGTISFADSLFEMNGMIFEVMVVMKGPNLNAGGVPGYIVGYLLDPSACNAGVCTYDYTTPFWKAGNDWPFPTDGTFQNTSHISLFYRKVGTSTPEPAALILLGTGLMALGLLRRRH